MILGSRAELAIRRTWRSFAHPHKHSSLWWVGSKKSPARSTQRGSRADLEACTSRPKTFCHKRKLLRCDTFWRSPPRHPVDSILTTHFEGALGPDDRDHGLRYLWLRDRASLGIIMCGLLNADDYVTTTRGSHEGRACSQLPKSPRTRQPIVPDQVAERALRQPATQ